MMMATASAVATHSAGMDISAHLSGAACPDPSPVSAHIIFIRCFQKYEKRLSPPPHRQFYTLLPAKSLGFLS